MIETAVQQQSAAMQRLQAAVAAEHAAQAAQAVAILELAREGDWLEGAEFDMIGHRPVRIGADGTLLVDETLPLEVAALTGTSVSAATSLIRDIVNLESRHAYAWEAVVDGRIPVWRARQLTQVAEQFGLGYGDCLLADAKIAPLLGVVGWGRVMARYRAAIIEVAPAKVAAANANSRAGRHVRFGTTTDDATLSWMSALADTSDVKAFEHLLGLVTKALVELGDTDPIDIVRSKALGRMADPEGVLVLLDGVEDGDPVEASLTEKKSRRRHAPVAQVFVHVTSDNLEHGGVARVERLGPVWVDDLSRVVGHHRINLTAIVPTGDPEPVVDAYEVPDRMREIVMARDRHEVFPWSSREARSLDLDHTVAWVEGAPGQTRPSNLEPLSRRPHRGKTHGDWRLDQPRPGVFWWRSPRGQIFRVGPDGTRNMTPDGTNHSTIERLRLWELDRRLGQTATRAEPANPA
ncbi:MAG: HNH endonuclease [Propionibacteriaceae bacterium]|nr:HNH endonuclease [Propionibacteriaceae bacterium]